MKHLKHLLFGGKGAATLHGDVALAILRVSLGLFIAAHGWQKFSFIQAFIDGTAALGFTIAPTFFAWSSILTELCGGLLIALGLFTRPVALVLVFNMGVAAFVANLHAPWLMGEGPAKEPAMLYLIPFLAFAVLGAGRVGVDAILRRK